MILQRANELAEQSDRVRATEALENDRQRYADVRDQLAELTRLLFGVWGTARLFRENQVAELPAEPSAATARQTAQEAATRFQANPAGILDQRVFRFSILRDQVQRLATDAGSRLHAAWAQYVATVMPNIQPEVLQTYAQLPEKAQTVAQIRQTQSQVNQLIGAPPRDAAQLHRFCEGIRELCRLWDGLMESGGVPDAVAEFLRLARTPGGAPLTLVTGEVVTWLRSKNMLDRYSARSTTVMGGTW